jgi:hypothetical protein
VKEHWKVVFDVATNSLDFGSGFLDDAEVKALRAAAVDLGVDPMEATPHAFKGKYCPGHEPKEHFAPAGNRPPITRCIHCDWRQHDNGEWKQW